jgi:hypothetical protein
MNSNESTLPNGAAWAAILAAAIGCLCFGIAADLSEASHGISKAFTFYTPTGDLSGKSTLAVIGWLVAWAVLHFSWRHQDIRRPGAIVGISVLLILVSMVMVFPPFVELIAAK